MSKRSMFSIATLMGRKAVIAAPTIGQQSLHVAKATIKAATPYAIMAAEVAGSIIAVTIGWKAGTFIVKKTDKAMDQAGAVVGAATKSAVATGEAALAKGQDLVHKATGVFTNAAGKAKASVASAMPKKGPTTVPVQESTLTGVDSIDLVGAGAPSGADV